MEPEDAGPADTRGGNHRRTGKKGGTKRTPKHPAREKNMPGSPIPRPEDLPENVTCNYPEWKSFLERYPMIHSLQREDFPEFGVSFVYVAHLYSTKNTAEESSLSQEEFENFFKEIGYAYDYSGNFESRWFEGTGTRIN